MQKSVRSYRTLLPDAKCRGGKQSRDEGDSECQGCDEVTHEGLTQVAITEHRLEDGGRIPCQHQREGRRKALEQKNATYLLETERERNHK